MSSASIIYVPTPQTSSSTGIQPTNGIFYNISGGYLGAQSLNVGTETVQTLNVLGQLTQNGIPITGQTGPPGPIGPTGLSVIGPTGPVPTVIETIFNNVAPASSATHDVSNSYEIGALVQFTTPGTVSQVLVYMTQVLSSPRSVSIWRNGVYVSTSTCTIDGSVGWNTFMLNNPLVIGTADINTPYAITTSVSTGDFVTKASSPLSYPISSPSSHASIINGCYHEYVGSNPSYPPVFPEVTNNNCYIDFSFQSIASGLQGQTGPTGLQGPIGPTGMQGIQGPTGNIGPNGVQGIQGPTGVQGIQGPTGNIGSVGAQGIQGPTGMQGIQGPTGVIGPNGVQGIQGPVGAQGPTGVIGPNGVQGIQGPTGVQGIQGPTGVIGPNGVQGQQGPVGAQGPTGVIGPNGVQGIQGPTGVQGIQGPTGNSGVTVLTGDVGVTGGSSNATISSATVTGKALTGFVSGAGSVSASDTILSAFNKQNGNIATNSASISTINSTLTGYATSFMTNEIESTGSTLTIGGNNATQVLYLASAPNIQTVSIGSGSSAKTINIGTSSDTVNITGTTVFNNTSNLTVTDKTIILNQGGATASGFSFCKTPRDRVLCCNQVTVEMPST
jgi:hypothetical protein